MAQGKTDTISGFAVDKGGHMTWGEMCSSVTRVTHLNLQGLNYSNKTPQKQSWMATDVHGLWQRLQSKYLRDWRTGKTVVSKRCLRFEGMYAMDSNCWPWSYTLQTRSSTVQHQKQRSSHKIGHTHEAGYENNAKVQAVTNIGVHRELLMSCQVFKIK